MPGLSGKYQTSAVNSFTDWSARTFYIYKRKVGLLVKTVKSVRKTLVDSSLCFSEPGIGIQAPALLTDSLEKSYF